MAKRPLQKFSNGKSVSLFLTGRMVPGTVGVISLNHRVNRVLGLYSSRPNWNLPSAHPQANVPPPFGFGGA